MEQLKGLSTANACRVNETYNRARYQTDGARIRAEVKAYDDANRGKKAVRNREYRAANRERLLIATREYGKLHYQTNKDQYLDSARRRRARRRGALIEPIERQIVWQRDEGVCHICGQPADPVNWHLDHIIPLCAGGVEAYWNVAVSHPRCNDSKGKADPRVDLRWAFLLDRTVPNVV